MYLLPEECVLVTYQFLLSAQYNLFRPKPAITEPTFHPAGSATPMSGSAVPDTAGGPLDTTGTASTYVSGARWFVDKLPRLMRCFESSGENHGTRTFFLSERVATTCYLEDPSTFYVYDEVGICSTRTRDGGCWFGPLEGCQSVVPGTLHSDDVEDLLEKHKMNGVLSSWKLLIPGAMFFHVLDLNKWDKLWYMFCGKCPYPIRARHNFERMLRPQGITVPTLILREVVVAGVLFRHFFKLAYENPYDCPASVSSSASPRGQTALWYRPSQIPLMLPVLLCHPRKNLTRNFGINQVNTKFKGRIVGTNYKLLSVVSADINKSFLLKIQVSIPADYVSAIMFLVPADGE
ncbi:hypothetical protein Tco_0158680 [Tanacetum coccineum]